MACGSGAFLVQVCIYLSLRLLEAWEKAEKRVQGSPRITPYGEVSKGLSDEQLIPLDRQERLIYARRLVAERCVYGVDKNPLAVEMAKLSLWLLTLAKDKPFTFLDHAIRCGDSLVGLSSIDQLLRFSMTENAQVRPLMEQQRQQIQKRLEATMLLRKQIETLPSNTPQDIERKTVMLANVEDQTKRLTYAGDLLLAATWEAKNVGELESALNGMLAEVEYKFKDLPADQLEEEAKKLLRKAGIAGRFHWPLEFPEVFVERGGFNAFVCNPPFMGGLKLETAFGTKWRAYVVDQIAEGVRGVRGTADLCTYFLLRASNLLRVRGQVGFLATNTVSQGDSRSVGLDQLAKNGMSIPRAIPSTKWPGTANLEVAVVWLYSGKWSGSFFIYDKEVAGITPLLTPPGEVDGNPFRLGTRANRSFQGSIVLGTGFVLEEAEREAIIRANPRNAEVIFPYPNGEDLNSRPDQSPSRYVINFRDWPLSRGPGDKIQSNPVATDYPECLAIIERRVKPERIEKKPINSWNKKVSQFWWHFGQYRWAMEEAISHLKQVLVTAEVSKHISFSFRPSTEAFSHMIIVFAHDQYFEFVIVQSSIHEVWARENGSTLETRFRYTPTSCYETFVFPVEPMPLTEIGRKYYEHRRGIMIDRQEGLTKTYNRFHDADESAAEIQTLRDLHVEMDGSVAAAYGWSDLDLGHGFHETKQGMRFTISESARREVLARLLKLNHERYAEEVAQGLHDKKGKPKVTGRKGKRTPSDEESLLF